jgi:hypothetical protein
MPLTPHASIEKYRLFISIFHFKNEQAHEQGETGEK